VKGTIALEEHFVPKGLEDCITGVGWDAAEWRGVIDRLTDMDLRLKEMDACGIEKAVLSLGTPGVQGIAIPGRATQAARQANDALARIIQRHPDRFGGFAALPMQDPAAAAAELSRAVAELGMCGALVNSHSDMPDGTPAYYDDVRFWPVWETAQSLGVPVYLHPRNPPSQFCGPYQGRPELLGPTWAFAVETGTHALRLIMRFHPVSGEDVSVICTDFGGEREALEAVARALDERRSLVFTHARYDREAGENGVIINLANVVSVRVSKTDSAATGQYL
jgi:predicted TIM-barrel fold metal-dependent hydrolase